MKIAVMGAGSVGSYYGAMLARAGHAVTLIARPRHVTAIADRGLLFETKAFTEAVPVTATADAAGVAGFPPVLAGRLVVTFPLAWDTSGRRLTAEDPVGHRGSPFAARSRCDAATRSASWRCQSVCTCNVG